jgi:uncharacterized membrane protein
MDGRTDRGATGLALLGLGLGSAQVAAPGLVARAVGARDDTTTRQVVRWAGGLREIASGLLVGTTAHPRRWLWVRVAGDALDLALLGAVLVRRPAGRVRAAGALAAVLGVTAADVATARRAGGTRSDQLSVHAAVTVNKPAREVYAHWRDFTNLPGFMAHLAEVVPTGEDRTRWTAHGPGRDVSWEAEVTADVPGELIAWRSLPGADVPNDGRVRFTPAPGGRGTEVRVHLQYRPPAGRLGAAAARVVGEDPAQQVRDDLRRFKQVLETGEVVRTESSPDGTRAFRQLRQHPAQPATT